MILTVFEMSYPFQTILVALGVSVITSIIAPSIMLVFSNQSRRAEKKADWQREDKKEAEKERKADEVANKLVESNERVAIDAKEVKGQLRQIHTLVNSNLTASMRNELDATIRELELMKQIIARDESDRIAILPEALSAVIATEAKITELKSALDDRLRQTELADKQLKQGA